VEIAKIFKKKIDTSKMDEYIKRVKSYSNGIHRLNITTDMLEKKRCTLEKKIDENKNLKIYSRLINANRALKIEVSDNKMYNNGIVILSISRDRVLNYINKELIELIGIINCNFYAYGDIQINIIYPEIGNTKVHYLLTTSSNKLQLIYDTGSDYKYLLEIKDRISFFSSSTTLYDDDNTIFNHSVHGKIIYEPDEEVIKIENEKIKTILEGVDNADTDDTKDKE